MQSEASLLLRMRLECSVHDAKGKRIKRFEQEGSFFFSMSHCKRAWTNQLYDYVRSGSQVLNEIHLHRGKFPHLTVIDTFVDGQHLTEAIVS
jgi:NADH kinase